MCVISRSRELTRKFLWQLGYLGKVAAPVKGSKSTRGPNPLIPSIERKEWASAFLSPFLRSQGMGIHLRTKCLSRVIGIGLCGVLVTVR